MYLVPESIKQYVEDYAAQVAQQIAADGAKRKTLGVLSNGTAEDEIEEAKGSANRPPGPKPGRSVLQVRCAHSVWGECTTKHWKRTAL